MAEIEPTTLRHNVGMCPACRSYLWADVTIAVTVVEPRLDDDGRARVGAHARPIAMSLSRRCDERWGETSA